MTGKIELAEDTITLNEEFKRNVAIPYFKDIYKDLVSQSDSKSKGINKVSFLTVSTLHSSDKNQLLKPVPSKLINGQECTLRGLMGRKK